MRSWLVLLVCSSLLGMACGGDPSEVQKVLQNIRYDVGGAVTDDATGLPLESVAVTVNGINAFEQVSTTDAFGLWISENLAPGMYIVTYELATYDTEVTPFALEAIGENDVADPYVSLGTRPMTGPGAVASVSAPFSASLEDGDNLVDGQGGETLVYTLSTDGDIVVTFDVAVFGGEVTLEDTTTGDTLIATVDNTDTVFTLLRTDIDQMDGANGLFADMNPATRHRLRLQNFDYTLGGVQRQYDADLRFNCVP